MGLSIHYSGNFKEGASLSEMIEEVKDIAESFKWKYTVFNNQFPESNYGNKSFDQKIYGICFTPPECETVFLSFLSNRKMSSPSNLIFYGKTDNQQEKKYLYMLSTKTQYAGIEVHKFVINLFHYLDKKYLQDFKLIDEGQFWETGNEKLLQEIFKRYTDLIEGFATALEIYPMNSGESFEGYLKRLAKKVHTRKKKD